MPDSRSAKQNARRRERRLAVLMLYGGKCACCGETEEAFLHMDHVFGGGNQHRQSLNVDQMYRLLLKERRADFQVLCANCNFAKDRPGGCPHQRVSE